MTPSEQNAAAGAWADTDPAGAPQAICSAGSLRALRRAYVALRREQPDAARRRVREAVRIVRAAVRALARGSEFQPAGGELRIIELGWLGTRTLIVGGLAEYLAGVPVDAAGLSALAVVYAAQPKPTDARHVVTVTDRAEQIHLARVPARVDLAILSPLDAVEVDGAPFVSPGPAAGLLAQYRRPREAQRAFRFAGPRSLAGAPVGDPVIRALASLPLTGDERSPIRGDVSRLATLAYAASGPMRIPIDTGAAFFGVARSEVNRKRWLNAALVFDSLILRDERTGRWVTLGRAESNGRTVNLSAPEWWHGKGDGAAWRLTGGLFRRLTGKRAAGGVAGFHAGLERTIAGLEAHLSWGPSAGKGKGGRIQDALRPVRPGGAGPRQWIPWRAVLLLAGEPVPFDAPARSTWGRRYRRRVDALIAAGYLVLANGGAAAAGDTIEIVRVHSGGKHRGEAGLFVRASARFCAAHADRVWTRLPASRVFESGWVKLST